MSETASSLLVSGYAGFELSATTQMLFKIGVFILVQALVYVILSSSSDVFSEKKMSRSLSFRPPRSLSIRRILAAVSDVPFGPGDQSPSPSPRSFLTHESYFRTDDCARS